LDQLVTIELFGHPFTFKAEKDMAAAKEVADFLVKEVTRVEGELSGKSTSVNKRAILILAALNIASEYFEHKRYHADMLEKLSQKTSNLMDKISVHLNG